jgi:integrase
MAAKLVKTETRGIYRRHAKDCDRVGRCGCPYVVVYRGKTRTFIRLVEAREGKAAMEREAKLTRGHALGLHRNEPRDGCPDCERELAAHRQVAPFFHAYALEWVERYQGTGRRGYREETRDEDRRLLKRYALKFFAADLRVGHVGPRLVSEFIGWLVKQPSQRGGTLSDKSVKNALQPVSSCLATARREGLIEHNPCDDAVLPHRPRIEEDEEEDTRSFPRLELDDADGEIEIVESMELVVSLINPKHRLMFELLAATGTRRSELIAFKVHDLSLNGEEIRRRIRRRRGMGLVVGALKSRYESATYRFRSRWPTGSGPTLLGAPQTTMCSPPRTGRRLTPAISRTGCWRRRARRPLSSGPASTPFATPSHRDSSPKGATSSRSSGGSDTTPRASRSTPTSTCSTRISGAPSSRFGSRKNHAKVRKSAASATVVASTKMAD